jgi:FkbH-like protein
MKLTEALRVNNAARNCANRVALVLATGFTPLPLNQFLAAHLSLRMPGFRADVTAGVYGDLVGNIGKVALTNADLGAVCMEWDDLDPRLGVRRLVATTWRDFPEIIANVRQSKARLVTAITDAAAHCRIAVALPQLSISAFSYSPADIVGQFEAELFAIVAEMQSELSVLKNVRVTRRCSSDGSDLTAALYTGFPYTTEFASELAEGLAKALAPWAPKKGIIVDLDETLWKGILGDDGIDGVHWDLDHKAQHHGLFQRFLNALSAEGTLVAVASKNAPEMVDQIFSSRSDLLLTSSDIFPIEVHWRPKSESVTRILDAWNVSADAVVFVDDSPLEIAEVSAAHPGIHCRRFPADHLSSFALFLAELREMFAKETIHEEDSIRAQSLRTRSELLESAKHADPETLLRDLKSELVFDLSADPSDQRALDLVNKTNQFNMNGRRINEPQWKQACAIAGAFVLTCTYSDKFGTLGKIAVLSGIAEGSRVSIQSWVMSCRAFARRIEFASLAQLFRAFSADEIVLEYRRTERNAPFSDMLRSLGVEPVDGQVRLSRTQFCTTVPALYHTVDVNSKNPEVETHV